jgi:hypothetical protein
MAIAVVTKASGGRPVVEVTATNPALGMPVTEVTNGWGMAVTKVSATVGGLPVTFVPVETGSGGGGGATWPSAADRPMWTEGTSTLSWSGPSGGGATGTAVPQTRVLTLQSTTINTSSVGQVIQGLNFSSAEVRIRHNNVVLKQCRIFSGNPFLIEADSGSPTGVIIEDCLIDGNLNLGTTGYNPTVGGGGSIIRRCNITRCENGIGIGENNMSIFDCWIHDLKSGGGAHTDGIQGTGGYTALTIRGNAIYSTDTSCIILQNESAGYSGLVVDSNLLVMNSGSACIVCRGDKSAGVVGTISITNNKLQKIGAVSYNDIQFVTGPVTYTGNTDYVSGLPITQGQ